MPANNFSVKPPLISPGKPNCMRGRLCRRDSSGNQCLRLSNRGLWVCGVKTSGNPSRRRNPADGRYSGNAFQVYGDGKNRQRGGQAFGGADHLGKTAKRQRRSFDLDGVIVSTEHLHNAAWQKIARTRRHRVYAGSRRQIWGLSRMEALDVILKARGENIRNRKRTIWPLSKTRITSVLWRLCPKKTSFPTLR